MSQLLVGREGVKAGQTILFEVIECARCATPFMVSAALRDYLRRSRDTFYCPNGHAQSYSKSTETILKEQHAKELQEKDNQLARERRLLQETAQAKNDLERKLKRVHKGVCPCCNRSFENLANHMKKKHPELVKAVPVAAVHAKINKKEKPAN